MLYEIANAFAVVWIYWGTVLQLLRGWVREDTGAAAKAPRLVAHRGLMEVDDGVVENTVAAFERCRTEDAEMVELDAQLTKDGEVVVFHDDCLARLHPKLSFSSVYTRELLRHQFPIQVPSLVEALRSLGQTPVLIEIKDESKDNIELVEKVKAAVDAAGDWSRVVWGSFTSSKVNRHCRTLKPDVATVLSGSETKWLMLAYVCGVLPFVSVTPGAHIWIPNDFGFLYLVSPMLRHLAKRGMVVVACNWQDGAINLVKELHEAFKLGATTVSTERYRHFRALLRLNGTFDDDDDNNGTHQ